MSEPWLSGAHSHLDPVLRPILFSLEQSSADLRQWTEGISDDQLWAEPFALGSLGFQLRHIAGSVDRLFTYAQNNSLSQEQLAFLRNEKIPGATLTELLDQIASVFDRVATQVPQIPIAQIKDHRGVGRKQLPTTVIGLLIHIAEHTQRHVGQAIVTVRVLKSSGSTTTLNQNG